MVCASQSANPGREVKSKDIKHPLRAYMDAMKYPRQKYKKGFAAADGLTAGDDDINRTKVRRRDIRHTPLLGSPPS